ncbi:IclR family transcriptional regulator [Halococcus hamelinensis]|uniref:ArcR family transcription regulator n=1 Tax=Halococcus hamelinensis 100A6 TaxID=1132509 RepID=M0LYT3_9EURY|nr:IclR family transcriptional regulator [Halococcus hamelinensis]EMA37280.1 ArcR family transcription regulator [Halococcus hamelinensis 100A6]
MGKTTQPLQTVARSFEIIDILWRLNGVGPTELAEYMDIPRSTAHDYLRTLESTGYVVHTGNSYRLGYRFLDIGGRLKHRNRFFHVARPVLQTLAEKTGELPNIGVEENGRCVIIHAIEGAQALELGIYPGLTLPIHSQATGKAILANLPEKRRSEIVESCDLERMTEHTITDERTLANELATIRENGYAVDWDQQVIGMGVIAAPVFVDDEVLGAVAIVAPTDRLKKEDYRTELVQSVREASSTIKINYEYGR